MPDPSMILYIIAIAGDIYGACLFGWWWAKRGEASLMFKCITALFLGDALERAFNIYGRFVILYGDPGQYVAFAKNPWYGTRTMISTIVTIIVAVYMTKRVLNRLDVTHNHPRRRAGD